MVALPFKLETGAVCLIAEISFFADAFGISIAWCEYDSGYVVYATLNEKDYGTWVNHVTIAGVVAFVKRNVRNI
jgi:hypothetical protein